MCCCEMGLKHDVSVSLFALSRHERYICVSMKVPRSCPMWNKRSHLDLFTFRTQVNWDDVVNFHHIYVNRCMCVTSLSDLAHHALPLNFLDTIEYQKMSCDTTFQHIRCKSNSSLLVSHWACRMIVVPRLNSAGDWLSGDLEEKHWVMPRDVAHHMHLYGHALLKQTS